MRIGRRRNRFIDVCTVQQTRNVDRRVRRLISIINNSDDVDKYCVLTAKIRQPVAAESPYNNINIIIIPSDPFNA